MRDKIKNAIRRAIAQKYGDVGAPEFSVEVPENPEHGDYSTNAALVIAKKISENPREVAAKIKDALYDKRWKVEAAGPGFLNFYLSDSAIFEEFGKILKEKNKYGRSHFAKAAPGKIQVEYISANPTGPLTLANGRGGFLGDALSNILEFCGYKVEREYYINDTGNQIITLGKSLTAAAGLIPGEESFYKGGYIKKWTDKNRTKVKKFKNEPLKLGQLAAKDFLADIKKAVLKKAGIKFDRWTSEDKQIHKKSFIKKALKIFADKELSYEKDGALWLKTAGFGDDKDRVLVTSDKFPTYFLADAGHYLESKKRGFDRKINILGPDHYGYVARIKAAAKIIGMENPEFIVTQAIRLMRDGREVKMSKRGGTFVAFEDLIDEVGLDAARYFFLERSPDSHIDFNLDLAKVRSQKNPVYYIQYAHARISSIVRKARNANSKSKILNPKLLQNKEEAFLIKKLIQFSEAVEDTAKDYQVNRLTRYALELARAFHDFYEKRRVISENKELTAARLYLVRAAQIILKSALNLLGIDAPDKM